jgi:hypothetical protein
MKKGLFFSVLLYFVQGSPVILADSWRRYFQQVILLLSTRVAYNIFRIKNCFSCKNKTWSLTDLMVINDERRK